MNRTASLLLAPLLLAATAAPAQTTFRLGLRGGVNRALTTVAPAGAGAGSSYNYATNKAALTAWQAGAVAEIGFGRLAFQPALIFSQKGEQQAVSAYQTSGNFYTSYEQRSTSRYNWLELPLHVLYTPRAGHGLLLLAGPYLALGVGGYRTGTETFNSNGFAGPLTRSLDGPLPYGQYSTNRRLDYGLDAGLGYRRGPFQVQLCYSLGLRNLHKVNELEYMDPVVYFLHNFNADAAYNRVLQLTGTYLFKL